MKFDKYFEKHSSFPKSIFLRKTFFGDYHVTTSKSLCTVFISGAEYIGIITILDGVDQTHSLNDETSHQE